MSWLATLESGGRKLRIIDLPNAAGGAFQRLPWLLRVLLENVLRQASAQEADAGRTAILDWLKTGTSDAEIPFAPSRVLMHDTTCVPALVDIAAMREVLAENGADASRLNPVIPVDVSVDHSVAVDHFAAPNALARNMEREFARNRERYRFTKWASNALPGVRIHPPGTGIMHTLNLERLATVVTIEDRAGVTWAAPDTLLGTDSHTPMINGLGVVAWGVGGVEAEGVLFGIPLMLRVPDIIGVRLTGSLKEGVLATDLALTVTERLRERGISGEFVEFFGPGVAALSVGQRAVVANMAPECGASSGLFPIDRQTCRYLEATGRDAQHIALVSDYAQRQGLWFDPDQEPRYTDVIELDLNRVALSVSGPRRPQDRLTPGQVAGAFAASLKQRRPPETVRTVPGDGAVAIAAITSCTNTSDPRLLIAAGLLARNARRAGLRVPPWVKTSLAPGSPAARRLLERAGLMDDLSALGFDIVGYGCTTCIGNSGPLTPEIDRAMTEPGIVPVAVLSGNRNFPGRVHTQLENAFLASPPLVVAFALAGDVNRDVTKDALGFSLEGNPVYLSDLWPSEAEIDAKSEAAGVASDIQTTYEAAEASPAWAELEAPSSSLFPWDEASTYIRRPPFVELGSRRDALDIRAHPLAVMGDDITTDHISPAGSIPKESDAGRHLVARNEDAKDLNVFAARRGNWEVMLRGLFTNRTVRNLLEPTAPPGYTRHAPSGAIMPIWQAADRYRQDGDAVVLVAGERYGVGSSRDWAAKGLSLLGVRAVLAVSFERIHRANLVGMGILPLRLPPELHPNELALEPGDRICMSVDLVALRPRATVEVSIARRMGEVHSFAALAAVETRLEIELLRCGGIIPGILQRTMNGSA